jgi:predicted hydrocarbon binding protein
MIVNIPKELATLDRNDFDKVCALVDKIVADIEEILTEIGREEAIALTKDYMIDLINSDLLDFDKWDKTT